MYLLDFKFHRKLRSKTGGADSEMEFQESRRVQTAAPLRDTELQNARTKRIAVLVNSLVENVCPQAGLQTFSQVTRLLLENLDTDSTDVGLKRITLSSSRAPPTSSSIAHNLVKSHGDRPGEIFSSLSNKDAELARRVASMLMKLAEGNLEADSRSSFVGSSPSVRISEGSATRRKEVEDPVVKERRLQSLKDFLSALQGVQGHFLRKRGDSSNIGSLSRGEMAVLEHAFAIGKIHVRVRAYAARLVSETSSGLVCQRLGHALRDELDGFDRFLSILEDSAFRDEGRVHLAQLHAWSKGVIRRLDILMRICEATEALRGGALISALYAQTCVGNSAHAQLANRLLLKAFQPLEAICKDFTETGRLQLDSHSEFFVARHRGKPLQNSEPGVYDEFELNQAMIPTFLGIEFAQSVLRIGYESKIARKLHSDRLDDGDKDESDEVASEEDVEDFRSNESSFPTTTQEAPSQSGLLDVRTWYQERLQLHVSRVQRRVNQSILDSLFKEHHLETHLFALKQFLLLGQGDFGQMLVELCASILDKPFEDVSRMELLAQLEHAVQCSNAFHHPEDVLARLDVQVLEENEEARRSYSTTHSRRGRLQPVQQFPVGNSWDAFALDYLVTFPLDLVITERLRAKYRKIFQFLWRVKRVQYCLEVIWKAHAAMATRDTGEDEGDEHHQELARMVHKSHVLRAEMVHFLSNLRSYVMFEVLETSWEQFKVDLRDVKSLGELLDAHETYLKNVLLKAMIVEDEDNEPEVSAEDGDFDSRSVATATSNLSSVSPALLGGLSSSGRKFRPSVSKSPIFSLRSSDATFKETKGLSIRLDQLFELMLKFCALQERLFTRIQEQRQAIALRRRRQMDLARRRRWLASSNAAPDRSGRSLPTDYEAEEEMEEDVSEDGDIVAEYQPQVEAVATEFWQSLIAFLSSLKLCSSENLRFLGLRLNFNHYY